MLFAKGVLVFNEKELDVFLYFYYSSKDVSDNLALLFDGGVGSLSQPEDIDVDNFNYYFGNEREIEESELGLELVEDVFLLILLNHGCYNA